MMRKFLAVANTRMREVPLVCFKKNDVNDLIIHVEREMTGGFPLRVAALSPTLLE